MTVRSAGLARVERVSAAGVNVWLVGDDHECVLIDAPGDAQTVLAAIGARRLLGILCSHGHRAHIAAALTVSDVTRAPTHLHADDYALWHQTFPAGWPDRMLVDDMTFDVAGVRLRGIHVPGHTDGGMCWYAGGLSVLFTGDSLSADGPGIGVPGSAGPLGGGQAGAEDRSRGSATTSDYSALVSAVRRRLFVLPPDTVVHPGHGPDGRIGTLRWDRVLWS